VTHRLAAISLERMHLWLMLVLTFATGVVDAVGYLGLDRVFTGNMTGNVVILGMALVGADNLPILGPALALIGFMGGAALGGRILKHAPGVWTARTTWLFGGVAFVVLGLGVALLAAGDDPGRPFGITVTTLLGTAMGAQAATARFVAVKDVTTVVVTSTITGLAADSVFGSGTGRGHSLRRSSAVVLILAGAAVGAALLKWHLGAGLLLAGAIALVATVVGALHAHLHHRLGATATPTRRQERPASGP
jgi:uncharacterized membrane protein YoaK (UPF0700 family)